MDYFPGDYYGKRCQSGKKSGDIFNDYLDLTKGVAYATKITWRLSNFATSEEYQSWEFQMQQGFNRCRSYDSEFDDYYGFLLAHRRVDVEVGRWWSAVVESSRVSATWEDFKIFLRDCFMYSRRVVPCKKSTVTMEAIKQPPKVVQRMADVGKSIPGLPKAAPAVAFHSQEKLAIATNSAPCSSLIEESSVGNVQMVAPQQKVNTVAATISEVMMVDVVKADVGTDVMEEAEPLHGLSMQLNQKSGDVCMNTDRGQRWTLFQTQCTIKEKSCKLIIDSGSYCNGVSKAVVDSLGFSTWRIPEPKHVQWVNSCGMLKITHKVRVPFTVGDYVDEIECDVLPLEVCGLLLGRPWQYDRNATYAGRANTYSFVHDGKQRTLKPMRDDQIQSDVELVEIGRASCRERVFRAV